MKRIGAHASIAGGIDRAVERGAAAGCDVLQIFTKNSNQWRARPLGAGEIARFRELQSKTGIAPVIAHDSYLINLASPDPTLHARSCQAFGEELDRCEALGIPALVAHPGAHMGAGEEAALARIAASLDALLAARPGHAVRVLLETTAGQGSCVGHRFEHLGSIMDRMVHGRRVGVCLDTCHVFAAGCDLRSEKGYHRTMAELDRAVGLGRVEAFHLNDSKKGLGSRVDRHEHIGQGALGVEAFRWLMNDPRFDGVPMVLETPKGSDGAEDRRNLGVLRDLIAQRRPRTSARAASSGAGARAR
ncbi:MAG TPA: deoxyribonuclease IV [Candidatus Polarisedimenticolia bacterium]|nr:deoxyribonuclease IV [Candidatus Polarisedimenticolia bacterium]